MAADCPKPPNAVDGVCVGAAVAPKPPPNAFDAVVAGVDIELPKPPNEGVEDCACDVLAPNMLLVAGCDCDDEDPKPPKGVVVVLLAPGCDSDAPNIFVDGGCTGCCPPNWNDVPDDPLPPKLNPPLLPPPAPPLAACAKGLLNPAPPLPPPALKLNPPPPPPLPLPKPPNDVLALPFPIELDPLTGGKLCDCDDAPKPPLLGVKPDDAPGV